MSVQSVNQPYFEDIAIAIREKNESGLVQHNIAFATENTKISNMLYMGNNLWLAINLNEGGIGYFREDKTGNIVSAGSQPALTSDVGSYVGAAYGDGVAVIVGWDSTLAAYRTATSEWVPATLPTRQYWKDVCYGDGVFFALAYNSGRSARSTDGGKSWTQVITLDRNWGKVVYGDGVFVAITKSGHEVMHSEDMGITWTGEILGEEAPFSRYYSIAYGKGKFIAVSFDKFAYSTDGKTWTEVKMPEEMAAALMDEIDIVYGAGMFIIVGGSNLGGTGTSKAWYSYDGIAWTGFTLTSDSLAWSKICYGDGEFWLMQQTNAVTATLRLDVAPIKASQFATEINNLSVNTPSKWETSILYQNGEWRSICYGGGKFVAFGNLSSNTAMYSLNGVVWTYMIIPSARNWNTVGYGGGKFVAIAQNDNTVAYSSDGVKWTLATMPFSGAWKSVAYGNGQFVAVSDSSAKAYSSDGITWKQITTLPNFAWTSVCYGGGKFIAVASNGAIWYNTGEDNWQYVSVPTSLQLPWRSVAYGNGRFVAFPDGGVSAAYSNDGITWSPTNSGHNANWSSVCYGGGMFVAVATGSSFGVYSTDGITWEAMSLTGYNNWIDVAYGNGKFVTIATNTSEGAYLTLPSSSWGNA